MIVDLMIGRHVRCVRFVLIVMLVISSKAHAQYVRCMDANGVSRFTDNAQLCAGQETQALTLQEHKSARVNYRYPEREYRRINSPYTIYVEVSTVDTLLAKQEKALAKLNTALDHVFSRLPEHTHKKLKQVSFYLMLGEHSPYGGENGGMRYISQGGVKR